MIKVQFYQLLSIDQDTNQRQYVLTEEVNTLALSAFVRHLYVKFSGADVISGAMHTTIMAAAKRDHNARDHTDDFFRTGTHARCRSGKRRRCH